MLKRLLLFLYSLHGISCGGRSIEEVLVPEQKENMEPKALKTFVPYPEDYNYITNAWYLPVSHDFKITTWKIENETVAASKNCSQGEFPPTVIRLREYQQLDLSKVTFASYKRCVDLGKCKAPQIESWSNLLWNDFRLAFFPVVGLTRQEMEEYCAAQQPPGTLPTWPQLATLLGEMSLGPPELVELASKCWAPWETEGTASMDACSRARSQVWDSPLFQSVPLSPPWHSGDKSGQDRCCTFFHFFSGVAERTITDFEATQMCDATIIPEEDLSSPSSSSHALFSPMADIFRAFSKNIAIKPVQIDDNIRSPGVGFRCAYGLLFHSLCCHVNPYSLSSISPKNTTFPLKKRPLSGTIFALVLFSLLPKDLSRWSGPTS